MSSVSHLASALSDHLHALLLDDVVLVWVQSRRGFRIIGKRVGNSISYIDRKLKKHRKGDSTGRL